MIPNARNMTASYVIWDMGLHLRQGMPSLGSLADFLYPPPQISHVTSTACLYAFHASSLACLPSGRSPVASREGLANTGKFGSKPYLEKKFPDGLTNP